MMNKLEYLKNRDLFVKLWFMTYLTHVFRVLDINEEVKDVLPTENISLSNIKRPKIFDHLLDFKILTKSGKIIIFEFKKNSLTNADLKQLFEYYKPHFCKDGENVSSIFIVISKGGKLTEYAISDIKFTPKIIKTKLINKQEDLKTIRNKFKNNIQLTSIECSLLVSLPLFDLEETEENIVKEICSYINEKPKCIPKDEIDGFVAGMYLNICEYIKFEEQDELLEMIDMETRTRGIRESIFNEGKNQGFNDGRKSVVRDLAENYSIEEVAGILKISVNEVWDIIND